MSMKRSQLLWLVTNLTPFDSGIQSVMSSSLQAMERTKSAAASQLVGNAHQFCGSKARQMRRSSSNDSGMRRAINTVWTFCAFIYCEAAKAEETKYSRRFVLSTPQLLSAAAIRQVNKTLSSESRGHSRIISWRPVRSPKQRVEANVPESLYLAPVLR